ncbi:intraflagellar transport protein 56 isoform X3 [Physcomitrium patens]|uniref:intraflagellar transport protein 56 isoform X3 n=1 Tax=Physcomitrium patens TaxID=3218 RepID=UPI000D15E754|nr:intraflagellar transport protein 56-like isoform X1 [Physcomitrium patens]|eukprot:XP_024372333.1 intraflagellar transport protein 56-like isoform X1 [Physcomitrella patens]
MILSKARSSSSHGERGKVHSGTHSKAACIPDFGQLLEARDYKGAITVLQFKRMVEGCDKRTLEWLAYAHFHHGEHDKALVLYKELLSVLDADPNYHTYSSACLFYLANYDEAKQAALRGPESPLQKRILLHIAHHQNDEIKLLEYHNSLGEKHEDQLSLASIHFLRTQYQEAIDIYKNLLLKNRGWLALNVFIALCYCNMDLYDVSLKVLDMYLQVHPESPLAVNIKACNNYKLCNGSIAEENLKSLQDTLKIAPIENYLVNHNIVVFRNGDGASQAWPRMLGILPEARMNLVIYHLKHGEIQDAYSMVKDFEATTPQEYIVKAVTCASLGQQMENPDLLKQAQQYFQLVGASASECDTIPGRQCMASCHFLLKQFDDALIYLKSIKEYSEEQDEFNWNYGLALAASGAYKEAEEALLLICSEDFLSDYYYQAWLSYCYIATGKANLAWEIHLRTAAPSPSFSLLLLIANECYKTGQYLYAAKAFDLLGQMEDSPEFWEGKRGALVGVFQKVVSGDEPKERLLDILTLLKNSNTSEAEIIVRVIKKWAELASA